MTLFQSEKARITIFFEKQELKRKGVAPNPIETLVIKKWKKVRRPFFAISHSLSTFQPLPQKGTINIDLPMRIIKEVPVELGWEFQDFELTEFLDWLKLELAQIENT